MFLLIKLCYSVARLLVSGPAGYGFRQLLLDKSNLADGEADHRLGDEHKRNQECSAAGFNVIKLFYCN